MLGKMTVREIYDNLLTELNKVEAPSLLLESFNYYFGKAINEVGNQWYSFYEQNQLLTDNLRVLTRTKSLTGIFKDGVYLYQLPEDYWHLLPGSILNYTVTPACIGGPTTYQAMVIKADSQMNSGIFKDYYTKPSYKRPYIYMHEIHIGTLIYNIQIKCGDDPKYKPNILQLDYLKRPLITELYLTASQLDTDEDESQIMEFPENFCYEIINKLTALVLEQNGDTNRLQVNTPLNQTMMPPRQG